MKDLAKIGLPLQIIGFLVMLAGWILLSVWVMGGGLIVHFVGDVLFFFQMVRQGAI